METSASNPHLARTSTQLGAIVRRERKKLRLSQKELARKIGSHQTTISQLENSTAQTRVETLLSVLAALDLELQLRPRRKGSTAEIEAMF